MRYFYYPHGRALNNEGIGNHDVHNRYGPDMHSKYGPLTRYVKLRFAHAPGMPGTFSLPPQVSNPNMHHGMCVTHVPWCMSGLLTSGFLWSRWRGKRSRHSRRMHNPQFYVSGKRPIEHGPAPISCSNNLIVLPALQHTFYCMVGLVVIWTHSRIVVHSKHMDHMGTRRCRTHRQLWTIYPITLAKPFRHGSIYAL